MCEIKIFVDFPLFKPNSTFLLIDKKYRRKLEVFLEKKFYLLPSLFKVCWF